MHMEPHVLNYSARRGMRLVEGMCLAIEAWSTAAPGTSTCWRTVDRGTRDGSRSAHFEHSVAITADGPLVLTAREENREKIASLGFPDPGF